MAAGPFVVRLALESVEELLPLCYMARRIWEGDIFQCVGSVELDLFKLDCLNKAIRGVYLQAPVRSGGVRDGRSRKRGNVLHRH